MSSRELDDLRPEIRQRADRFLALCAGADLDVLIYCTFRSHEEQARLFRKGRTLGQIKERADVLAHEFQRPDLAAILIAVGPQPETRVATHAGPGQSLHYYRLAFDGVPLRQGKPVWGSDSPEDRELWNRYGALGESAGLQWAGHWPRGRIEFPHLQDKGANWRELIQTAA